MSGEKTEPPTPKRLRDARKKGQVSKSNDLTQAFLFLTAAGVLSASGGAYIAELRELMADFFRPSVLSGEMRQDEMLHLAGYAWARFLLLAAPLLGALFVVSAAISFLQVNVLFAPEVIKPNLDKLNPLKGFQNIFLKARTYLELVKNLLKLVVIGLLAYSTIEGSLRDVVFSARASLLQSAELAGEMLFRLLFRIGGVFLIIGAADYMLQKKQYLKGLMMSKYEVQREYKEEEGDPHVKHMRKQLHEELLAEGMMEHVPKADVVVVNPTHLAVAVKYDEKAMNAPQVTAKGQHLAAQKIIEVAKKHRVPILRNVTLAHSLFELEVGREIPEDLYEAVAEVLNWVYGLAQAEAPAAG